MDIKSILKLETDIEKAFRTPMPPETIRKIMEKWEFFAFEPVAKDLYEEMERSIRAYGKAEEDSSDNDHQWFHKVLKDGYLKFIQFRLKSRMIEYPFDTDLWMHFIRWSGNTAKNETEELVPYSLYCHYYSSDEGMKRIYMRNIIGSSVPNKSLWLADFDSLWKKRDMDYKDFEDIYRQKYYCDESRAEEKVLFSHQNLITEIKNTNSSFPKFPHTLSTYILKKSSSRTLIKLSKASKACALKIGPICHRLTVYNGQSFFYKHSLFLSVKDVGASWLSRYTVTNTLYIDERRYPPDYEHDQLKILFDNITNWKIKHIFGQWTNLPLNYMNVISENLKVFEIRNVSLPEKIDDLQGFFNLIPNVERVSLTESHHYGPEIYDFFREAILPTKLKYFYAHVTSFDPESVWIFLQNNASSTMKLELRFPEIAFVQDENLRSDINDLVSIWNTDEDNPRARVINCGLTCTIIIDYKSKEINTAK